MSPFKLFVAVLLTTGFIVGVPVGWVLYFFFDPPCPWLP